VSETPPGLCFREWYGCVADVALGGLLQGDMNLREVQSCELHVLWTLKKAAEKMIQVICAS